MQKENNMKGIILAGGSGTRLYPITQLMCKQLLPVYDKPMIYYPLSTLMLAGIKEILIISTPKDISPLINLFGDGSHLGINITYKVQDEPKGIAQAFIIGKDFIGSSSCMLILGDNIFYGNKLQDLLINAVNSNVHATIFSYKVKDPERYGVVEITQDNKAVSLEEKPKNPKSNLAVVGIYIYNSDVVQIAENLKPSGRGEFEITDINKAYLEKQQLKVVQMGRGYVWLDTGTTQSLLDASLFFKIIEERKGMKVACVEEIAYTMGYITKKDLENLAKSYINSDYGKYLINLE